MKAIVFFLCLSVLFSTDMIGQSNKTSEQVIEGGKVVVELIKALSKKKDQDQKGCVGKHADLCVTNDGSAVLRLHFFHRASKENRELIIQSGLKECCLQVALGVWTYEIRSDQAMQPIRKGDLLIESCQNVSMNIRY